MWGMMNLITVEEMNILHIVNEPLPVENGGGTHMIEVERGLKKLGHDVIVVCPKGKLSDYGEIGGIIYYRFNIDQFKYRAPILFFPKLFKIIKKHKIDLILERWTPLGGAGLLAAKIKGLSHVFEVNSPGLEAERALGKVGKVGFTFLDMYRKFLFEHTNKIKCDCVECIVYPELREKAALIQYGTDVEKFKPREKDNNIFKICYISSFQRWHGAHNLIPIAKALKEYIFNFKFVVMGEGPDFNIFKKAVKDNKLSENFEILGNVPHDKVPKIMGSCDVGIAPFDLSQWLDYIKETGFFFRPVKIFEYASCGLPVVTNNISPLNVMVEHGETGLLADMEDDYVDNLILLYNCNMIRTSMGEEGRKKIVDNGWTWENHCKKLNEVLLCLKDS